MPLRGHGHSKLVQDVAPFFENLADLDAWAANCSKKLNGLVEYRPRRQVQGPPYNGRGKLLVCHDYKGGYTEIPSALSYTFNFWSYCDTFVYFSHHRVTIPPSGWVTAAHRQGARILGTLIFEGGAEGDCLRLLVGHLPNSKTGVARPSGATTSLPLSPHYARLLAELARQRGFDGYLLNFECPLQGGVEQTRVLAAWITLLRTELEAKVGPHSETIWYDSVIFTGQLAWQDRLNSLNLPFFLASTGFFTNYTWQREFPSLSAQYFLSLDSSLTSNATLSLQDIYTGVDVWGRGSHGGGGLGSYKALTHIDPEFLGLSAALFGQAWTWESEQDKPGWTWEKWWEYESTLWVGTRDVEEIVSVPEAPQREDEPECVHGPFLPITTFFPRLPPPNPKVMGLLTTFSPGVGKAWFVEGVKVLQTENGWTDIDKQGTLGDMVWPRPHVSWEGDEQDDLVPKASANLTMDDAWNGGSCLRLGLSGQGSDAENAFFRCLWLPIQSLALTPLQSYEAIAVFKIESVLSLDVDIGISVKLLSDAIPQTLEISPSAVSHTDLSGGWTKLSIQIIFPTDHPIDVLCAIGLVIGLVAEDPTQDYELSLLMGQITVFPTTASQVELDHRPAIMWASFGRTPNPTHLAGILTWEISTSFPQLPFRSVVSREDPTPPWNPFPTNESWFPSFIYFNIYVEPHNDVMSPEKAVFIGTTGLDGMANRFYVDPECLPEGVDGRGGVRFYVQGVTDRGEVLGWDRGAFVYVE